MNTCFITIDFGVESLLKIPHDETDPKSN